MAPDEQEIAAQLWWESSMSVPHQIDDPPTQDALAARLVAEPWKVTLAWRGEAVVGLLATQAKDRWLRQLFVAPQAKRTGVGRQLLAAAQREMPQGFYLHTHPENLPARRFYEAQGLVSEGVQAHPIYGTPQVRYAWRGG